MNGGTRAYGKSKSKQIWVYVGGWVGACVHMCVTRAQSCWVLCDPVDYSSPGSSVHVISQARILEWVAISFSRGSSLYLDASQGYEIVSFHTGKGIRSQIHKGSSVNGIFQARILEWVAISFSRESSLPRNRTQVFCTAGMLFTV